MLPKSQKQHFALFGQGGTSAIHFGCSILHDQTGLLIPHVHVRHARLPSQPAAPWLSPMRQGTMGPRQSGINLCPSVTSICGSTRYSATPPPRSGEKTQRSGATFRQAVFSAKQVPSAQALSPRAQTHLPFGCSVVGVMWKPKASLNLEKNFHLSVCTWFLMSDMSESATGPVAYALSTH